MFFQISESERKKAKSAHEVFMLNLVVSHLFMAPATIALKVGVIGFLIPLFFSLSSIAFIYWRSRKINQQDHWFALVHWRMASKRSRLLIIAYLISAVIIAVGLIVAANTEVKTTKDIMMTVFSRLAVVPVLIMVMVCFVLESGAIYQTTRGEIPNKFLQQFPAPAHIPQNEEIMMVNENEGANLAASDLDSEIQANAKVNSKEGDPA